MHTYDTVSEAVSELKARGFTEDFNLDQNCLVCNAQRFHPEEFEITEVHRFEGDSDPGDEAVVYAIESLNGVKGVLVNSYGYQSDTVSNEMVKKLQLHTN